MKTWTQTITITTIDDTDIESDEQFFVNLTNATNGVVIVDDQGIERKRMVSSDTVVQLNLSAFNSGVYIVKVQTRKSLSAVVR